MAQTKKPLSSRMFRLVAGLVFCWMLLLNCLTPYLADDYTFAYAFDTGERLHSLPQLISSLVFHYHEWSGRVIVKFFAQGFTMFPKLLFNVCNAGMFMALGLVLYKLAVGRRSQKADWLVLALIYAALWEISPVFGQTNLWMRRLQLPVGHGGMLRLFVALAVLFAAAVCQYGAHGGRHGVGRAAGWLVKREYQRRNAGLFGAGRRCCIQAGAQAARLDGNRPGGGAGWVCFAHHRARQL